MAQRLGFQSCNAELQQFVLPEVRLTGRQLGVGSYGSVVEIEINGLVCAGKQLHEALLDRNNTGIDNIQRKYLAECQVMAAMRHPHIVQFLGLCFLSESRLPVLVMEKMDSSLDELLENRPGLPLALKRSLLADTALGLAYLHTRNPPIVHRDLSSRNILLTSSLSAKISDLGNARMVDIHPGHLARTMTRLPGSFVYMPPEAFHEGSRYGPSLDIFSFGHLALFTLTQVFPGDLLPSTYIDPMNRDRLLARSELDRRGDYIQQLNGMLGERHSLVCLVCQCLHNNPAQRPPARELFQQLEAAKALVDEVPYDNMDMEKVRALNEKDTQIRQLQQLMQSLEERLQVEGDALQQKDTLLQQKDTLLQQKNSELQLKGTELQERATQINRQQRELQTLREDKGRLQQQGQRKDVEISRQQRELQALRDQSVAKDERLTAAQSQLQQMQGQNVAKLTAVQSQLKGRTASKDKSVATLQSQPRQPHENMKRLQVEVELQQKDTQLQQQATKLQERATQISRQQRELQTLMKDKGQLQQQAQGKDMEISRLLRELRTLRDQNVARDKRLTALRSQSQRQAPSRGFISMPVTSQCPSTDAQPGMVAAEYTAALFQPRQIEDPNKPWRVVWTVCRRYPSCATALRNYLLGVLGGEFWPSSFCIHFTGMEVRLNIPEDRARDQGYTIVPNIQPCMITKLEADPPSLDFGTNADGTYPLCIVLDIDPLGVPKRVELNCLLEVMGIEEQGRSFRLKGPNVTPPKVARRRAGELMKDRELGVDVGELDDEPQIDFNDDQGVLNMEPDFKMLNEKVVARMPLQWEQVGYALGISHEKIECIKEEMRGFSNSRVAFRQVLSIWKKETVDEEKRTWRELIRVLESPEVGETFQAKKLKSELLDSRQ